MPETRSELVVPLIHKDKLVGVFDLESTAVNRFTEEHVKILTPLASQAAVAIENARLYERLVGTDLRVKRELRIARGIQHGLFPEGAPDSPYYEASAHFQPAQELGGDLYDFYTVGEKALAVAVGDVVGKGVPAALLVASLKSALRTQLRAGAERPAELVARVNRLFHEVTPRGRFATLFVGIFDLAAGRLDYVSAGHDYPFVVRADGVAQDLSEGGTVLGLIEDASYESGTTEVARGDLVVLYTDGVTDRPNAQGEPYGAARLKQAAARNRGDSARIALYSILGDAQGWSAGCPAEDDRTLVVVKRT